jgi:hypothetical protein
MNMSLKGLGLRHLGCLKKREGFEIVEVIAMVDGKRVNYRYMVFCNNCNKTVLTKTNKAVV